MTKLVLDGVLETLKTRMDGTVTLTFSLQELEANKAGELFALRGKYCKALFSDTSITENEKQLVENLDVHSTAKTKSPSYRLRSVLYLVHERMTTDQDFETYYKNELEKIIDHYKNKINN